MTWRGEDGRIHAIVAGPGRAAKLSRATLLAFPFFRHAIEAMLKPILLVEDSQRDLDTMLGALKRAGLTESLFVVRDGDQAVDYLLCRNDFRNREKGRPRLMILDLYMNAAHGFDVLEEMRKHPHLDPVPVIALASEHSAEDEERCAELGADAYIVKPIDRGRFIQVVKDLCMHRRNRDNVSAA
jgi:CheY-like chemotaxis protein